MKEHECEIGILTGIMYGYNTAELVTITNVKEEIEERKTLNGNYEVLGLEECKIKEWTLKQYCDRRVSTNLRRFDYCPTCGKKIDWKAMRGAT